MLGIQLIITDDAINVIAEEVYYHKLGARYIGVTLNSVLSDLYLNYHDYQGKTFLVNGALAKQKLSFKKYHLVFKAFESNTSVEEIEQRFGLNKDEILDLFLQWESMKNEEGNSESQISTIN